MASKKPSKGNKEAYLGSLDISCSLEKLMALTLTEYILNCVRR